jgi:hypothetical protein
MIEFHALREKPGDGAAADGGGDDRIDGCANAPCP